MSNIVYDVIADADVFGMAFDELLSSITQIAPNLRFYAPNYFWKHHKGIEFSEGIYRRDQGKHLPVSAFATKDILYRTPQGLMYEGLTDCLGLYAKKRLEKDYLNSMKIILERIRLLKAVIVNEDLTTNSISLYLRDFDMYHWEPTLAMVKKHMYCDLLYKHVRWSQYATDKLNDDGEFKVACRAEQCYSFENTLNEIISAMEVNGTKIDIMEMHSALIKENPGTHIDLASIHDKLFDLLYSKANAILTEMSTAIKADAKWQDLDIDDSINGNQCMFILRANGDVRIRQWEEMKKHELLQASNLPQQQCDV